MDFIFLLFFSRDARRGLLAPFDESFFGEVLAAYDELLSRRLPSYLFAFLFFSRRTTSLTRDAR